VADLFQTLTELFILLAQLGTQLLYLALQYSLLLVWLAWALFGLNWKKVWPALREGAWAPVVLISILAALVWASMVPDGFTALGFVTISNFWAKLLVVWLLIALTCFCGWLQRVIGYAPPEISVEPPAAAHEHGHGHHH